MFGAFDYMKNYQVSTAVIFCAAILMLALTLPVIMEAEAKKEIEKKVNESFDEKCIKLFMKLKQSGEKFEKIEEKLIKAECMDEKN